MNPFTPLLTNILPSDWLDPQMGKIVYLENNWALKQTPRFACQLCTYQLCVFGQVSKTLIFSFYLSKQG